MIRNGLVVQWPDTHVPDHHKGAVSALMRFIVHVQPELVIFTGDLLDGLSLARWTAETIEENGKLFQKEIDEAKRLLSNLRDVYAGRIAWMPGNHEARLAKWGRTRGRGLFGIDVLTVPNLIGFDDLGIETPAGLTEETAPWEFAPGVLAVHGTTIRKYAGYSVHAEMEKFGKSIIMGHTHRLAVVHRSNYTRSMWGMEGGHLMNQKKAKYLAYGQADWQMGFGLVNVTNGQTTPAVVPMRGNGSFDWGGTTWVA